MNERHREPETKRSTGEVPAPDFGGEPPRPPKESHAPYFTKDGELVISERDFARWRAGNKEEGSDEQPKVVYVAHLGPDRMLNLGCEGGINSRRPVYFNSDGCLVMSEEDFERHWKKVSDGRRVNITPELGGGDKKINMGCGGPVQKRN